MFSPCLTFLFAIAAMSSFDATGDRLVKASHDKVAAMPGLTITQTVTQRGALMQDGKELGKSPAQVQKTVIEIDNLHAVCRLTATQNGAPQLVAIRKGAKVAVKQGDGAWAAPEGPLASIREQIANPFACPLPTPGADSPQWRVVRMEKQQGDEVYVIQTVGNSAIGYAEKRMREGFSASAGSMGVKLGKVKSYVATHWVRKRDHMRLKVEQKSEFELTLEQNGQTNQIAVTANTLAEYARMVKPNLQIPEDALKALK